MEGVWISAGVLGQKPKEREVWRPTPNNRKKDEVIEKFA
jgi:hypothetical protein